VILKVTLIRESGFSCIGVFLLSLYLLQDGHTGEPYARMSHFLLGKQIL